MGKKVTGEVRVKRKFNIKEKKKKKKSPSTID